MPAMKEKISISPIRNYEAVISTFVDRSRYEIISMDIHQNDMRERYAKKVYGEWCCPLKICVAMGEQVIVENDVRKIISLGIQTCHYPFVLGDPQKWIDKEFDYYPIESPNLCFDLSMIHHCSRQLRKALSISMPGFLIHAPLAIYRGYLSHMMYKMLLKSLPLSKEPKKTKLAYEAFYKKMIEAEGFRDSLQISREFEKTMKQAWIRERPKHRILLSGDFSLFIMDFFLFELDVFLAGHQIEIVQSFSPFTSMLLVKHSSAMKKAKTMLKKTFSNSHNDVSTRDRFVVENITLAQILKGVEEKVDGIIYIKPLMCTPCDNVSYVLKKENHFDLPFVEISYDEHSGINGIMTRLEAFINIVQERKS